LKNAQCIVLTLTLLSATLSAGDKPERRLVQHDTPEYPDIAAKMSLHGTVKLKIWIAPNGAVTRLEYVGGHPLLAESALKAVRGWKYEAADKETTQVVEVKF